MTFTALEALFFTLLCSLIVGIVVRSRSVSPRDCANHRAEVEAAYERQEKIITELKKSNDIQFRTLRALVAHSDLPANIKAEILNMGPAE